MSNENFNYKKLTPFKWFVLQNFPFIDEDFDAITNYQLFCKLGEEINKIINSQNLLGEQVEELTNAFNELQNYVNNYFENLDVQEEINNKLDDMAESGELADIIAQFLNTQVVRYYESVSEMVADNEIENGNKLLVYDTERLSYKNYAVNDTDSDGVHLSNGLYATIVNHSIIELNIEDFSQYVVEGDWIPAFTKAFEYIYNSSVLHDAMGVVNLGNAQYTCESTLTIPNRVIIDGHDCGGLVFTDDEHDYINFVTKDGIFVGNGGGIRNVTISEHQLNQFQQIILL